MSFMDIMMIGHISTDNENKRPARPVRLRSLERVPKGSKSRPGGIKARGGGTPRSVILHLEL